MCIGPMGGRDCCLELTVLSLSPCHRWQQANHGHRGQDPIRSQSISEYLNDFLVRGYIAFTALFCCLSWKPH